MRSHSLAATVPAEIQGRNRAAPRTVPRIKHRSRAAAFIAEIVRADRPAPAVPCSDYSRPVIGLRRIRHSNDAKIVLGRRYDNNDCRNKHHDHKTDPEQNA